MTVTGGADWTPGTVAAHAARVLIAELQDAEPGSDRWYVRAWLEDFTGATKRGVPETEGKR